MLEQGQHYNCCYAGSASAFRKVYEEPIIASRQPTATNEEKVMGEARASQVHMLFSMPLSICMCIVIMSFNKLYYVSLA